MDDQLPKKVSPVSSPGGPERRGGVGTLEKAPSAEVPLPKESGIEVEDYLTKLETGEEIQLPQAITDDSGQPILSPATPQQITITLPMTEEEIRKGLGVKIANSLRWLTEWCLRLVKISRGRITYRLEKKEVANNG